MRMDLQSGVDCQGVCFWVQMSFFNKAWTHLGSRNVDEEEIVYLRFANVPCVTADMRDTPDSGTQSGVGSQHF